MIVRMDNMALVFLIINKSPNGFVVGHPEQACAQSSPLVSGQVPLSESGSRSGSLEPCSRFSVETETQSGGMDVEPSDSGQIWDLFGEAKVDLFASQESSQYPLWFSLSSPAALGIDTFAYPWPNARLYVFPPVKQNPAVLCRVKESGVRLLLVAPFWPSQMWFSELIPLLYRPPWEIPIKQDLFSQLQCKICHPQPRDLEAVGMAHPEPRTLISSLPAEVQETIANARAPATRKLYSSKMESL